MIPTSSDYSVNTLCEISLFPFQGLFLYRLTIHEGRNSFFLTFFLFFQVMNLPPSSWFATRLRWMQPQWGRWKPHFTWSVLSVPRNTLQKWWAAWHESQRLCSRPEPIPTCRTARAGRSQGFWLMKCYAKVANYRAQYDGASVLSFVIFRTPLHEAVASGNEPVFNQLLQCKQWVTFCLQMELMNLFLKVAHCMHCVQSVELLRSP